MLYCEIAALCITQELYFEDLLVFKLSVGEDEQ